ncbi:hypothetical protein I79_014845 [Cricetulus griseus]|uniref:Uncharacterized protein n=1 Tax=Cricetulus griseus TaxID=10029 RepID=G3HV68_CRIGR|nr:hypothetical protein I79_014845 [Cricetulus griseus]
MAQRLWSLWTDRGSVPSTHIRLLTTMTQIPENLVVFSDLLGRPSTCEHTGANTYMHVINNKSLLKEFQVVLENFYRY